MARRILLSLVLAAGCTPAPALVPPPETACRPWVLPPPPPAPRPLSDEERARLEAEWPPVWFPGEWDLPQERRPVVPRVRLIHPPVGSSRATAVVQARCRPEAVILRADGRCDPEARPALRAAGLGCPGPTPTSPGR